jgi:hypothetical protein
MFCFLAPLMTVMLVGVGGMEANISAPRLMPVVAEVIFSLAESKMLSPRVDVLNNGQSEAHLASIDTDTEWGCRSTSTRLLRRFGSETGAYLSIFLNSN